LSRKNVTAAIFTTAIITLSGAIAGHADEQGSVSTQASFDCSKAKTLAEKSICQNDDLKEADKNLAALYQAVLAKAPNVQERKKIEAEEKHWIEQRDLSCGLTSIDRFIKVAGIDNPAECLSKAYEHRNWELQYSERYKDIQEEKLEISFPKYPFTPKLQTSTDDEVCDPFLKGVQKHFTDYQQAAYEDTLFGAGPLPPGTFNVIGGAWLGGKEQIILISPHGNQKAQTFLIKSAPSIHMTSEATLYTKPGVITEEEIKELSGADSSNLENNGWKKVTGKRTGGDDEPLYLLRIKGSLYLYKNGDEEGGKLEENDIPSNAAALYKVAPDGTPDLICAVSVEPTIDISSPPLFWNNEKDKKRHKSLDAETDIKTPDAVKKFFDATTEVAGASVGNQPCVGTDGPYVWARYSNTRDMTRYLALVRPWEVMQVTKDYDLINFRNQWGMDSLHNYRIYEQIAGVIPSATQALTDFYIDNYGLDNDDASSVAGNVMDQLFAVSLQTYHSGIDPEVDASIEADADVDNLDGNVEAFRQRYLEALKNNTLSSLLVRKAILTGMTDVVENTPKEKIIELQASLPKEGEQIDPFKINEPFIFYALDNQKMLNLLIDKGLDVSTGNWFGKSPLMYAAQWNRPEIINTLLAHHANVNSATTSIKNDTFGCSGAPHITKRTALMYAAENASASLIEVLLKAGADAKAKDSEGRSIQDYLAKNELINDVDRKRINDLLQK